MTAPPVVANRATFIDQLASASASLRESAACLDLAQYTDVSLLCADRARLRAAAGLADDVMGSLALLGIDPEARD